jgi:hypothetical protein
VRQHAGHAPGTDEAAPPKQLEVGLRRLCVGTGGVSLSPTRINLRTQDRIGFSIAYCDIAAGAVPVTAPICLFGTCGVI